MVGAKRFLDGVFAGRAEQPNWRSWAQYARGVALNPAEQQLIGRYRDRSVGTLFIVAPPYAGAALLTRLMARHLEVAWTNQHMNTRWATPVLAARQALRRWGLGRGQVTLVREARSPTDPHTLEPFWHHWFESLFYADNLTLAECEMLDTDGLYYQVRALSGVFEPGFPKQKIKELHNLAVGQVRFSASGFA